MKLRPSPLSLFFVFAAAFAYHADTEKLAIVKDCAVDEMAKYRSVLKIAVARNFEVLKPGTKAIEVKIQDLDNGNAELCVYFREKTLEEKELAPAPPTPPAKPKARIAPLARGFFLPFFVIIFPIMMPMPIWKRRLYLLVLSAAFFLAIPVLLLYTSGYRLGEGLKLVKTGGIFVSAPISGAEIYINNQLEKTTNLIQRNLFAQNLSPGTYFIFVYKEGYWPWSKELRVHEKLVADANAFLIPREPKAEEILPANSSYKNVLALFSGRPLPASATLTTESAAATTTVMGEDIRLRLAGQTIYAEWLGERDKAPSHFCDEYKTNCVREIPVFTSQTKIKTFDFYPGRDDVVVLSRKSGVYAVEMDQRKIQNFALVYGGGDPDFRVGSDGNFYIKDGSSIYTLDF